MKSPGMRRRLTYLIALLALLAVPLAAGGSGGPGADAPVSQSLTPPGITTSLAVDPQDRSLLEVVGGLFRSSD